MIWVKPHNIGCTVRQRAWIVKILDSNQLLVRLCGNMEEIAIHKNDIAGLQLRRESIFFV